MITSDIFILKGNKILITPDILMYQPFRDVYNLDGATNKEEATRYFTYIWHHANPKAVPVIRGYSPADTHIYACKQSDLTDTFKPHDKIKVAIKFYKTNFISPVKEKALALLNSISKNTKIANVVDDLIEKKLQEDNITHESIAALISLQKDIVNIIAQFPTQVKTLKEIEKMIDEEEKGIRMKRGGDEIKHSMLRDNDVES